nr:LacI family DNA-binding transcriptional regulator [Salsipaludibacter albus]
MKEVARLAGVSRSTTSRVLNDHPSVRPEVRARVQEVMEDVGYVPDGIARSLRRGHTGMLGLLIPQPASTVFGDAYFATLVSAVVDAAQRAGCTVATVLTDDPLAGRPDTTERLAAKLSADGLLDGVVATASVDDDPVPGALLDAGLPVVVIGEPSDASTTSVDVDNLAGGRLAVEHLVELGRARVAVLAGPEGNPSARRRLEGARRAVEAAAVTLVGVEAADHFGVEDGRRAMDRMLAAGTRPDALVAGSDAIAVGAMAALDAHGLRVPDDVAVAGFDDLAPARVSTPPLTTVAQPVASVGRLAVHRLLDLVGTEATGPARDARGSADGRVVPVTGSGVDGHEGRRTVLDVALVVRGSTVPD